MKIRSRPKNVLDLRSAQNLRGQCDTLQGLREVESAMNGIVLGPAAGRERTGKRISAELLRAVPWTRFTKEIAAGNESGGGERGSGVMDVRTARARRKVPAAVAPDRDI